MSNDTTASAGVLFNTLGAPLASTQQANCIQTGSTTASCPQVGGPGERAEQRDAGGQLPGDHHLPGRPLARADRHWRRSNGACRKVSYPELYNDVFWQNRSFYIGVGALGARHVEPAERGHAATTRSPGRRRRARRPRAPCPAGVSYWDIGVRGDTGPTNHASTVTLRSRGVDPDERRGLYRRRHRLPGQHGGQSGRRQPVLQRFARPAGVRRHRATRCLRASRMPPCRTRSST